MFLTKRKYFNKTIIIKGLIIAFLFSSFIYLSYFDFQYKTINTIIALLSLYFIIINDRQTMFYIGFFVGIFWFYWVSFSFVYYDLAFLIPLIILVFAFSYGVLFYLCAFFKNIYLRITLFSLLGFISPFGFNWFKPELILINTYFQASFFILFILLLAVYFLVQNKSFLFFILIISAFSFSYYQSYKTNNLKPSALNIHLSDVNISQDKKWDKANISHVIDSNFQQINQAIKDKKDLIILPETAFPLVLNKEDYILDELIEKSQDINIITGALFYKNKQYNNSTFYIHKGKVDVAHKVVLVPFGEAVPLPEKIRNFINDVFYDGAKDYEEAKEATNFTINNLKFRNAICYEATTDKIYEDLNGVQYVIATSNNAWFTPSIEPILQKLLLRYYAQKYNVIIYHSANGSKSEIIKP